MDRWRERKRHRWREGGRLIGGGREEEEKGWVEGRRKRVRWREGRRGRGIGGGEEEAG